MIMNGNDKFHRWHDQNDHHEDAEQGETFLNEHIAKSRRECHSEE